MFAELSPKLCAEMVEIILLNVLDSTNDGTDPRNEAGSGNNCNMVIV